MLRQFLMATLLIAAAAIPSAADDRRRNPRNPGYGYGSYDQGYGYSRGGNYGNDGNYGYNGRRYQGGNPVTAALRDLENVFDRARVDSHEASHFRRALRELHEFDQRAARGRFDHGSLDRAMDNMEDLARADQLHPRDRQLIARRLDDLRYFSNRGAWR
ncbi:MAG TPA: hypothetical protein PLZ95_13270 [Bryobacteraceae bacterium]|nr:hypothetical protein [Bryobacteraceae bacterium]